MCHFTIEFTSSACNKLSVCRPPLLLNLVNTKSSTQCPGLSQCSSHTWFFCEPLPTACDTPPPCPCDTNSACLPRKSVCENDTAHDIKREPTYHPYICIHHPSTSGPKFNQTSVLFQLAFTLQSFVVCCFEPLSLVAWFQSRTQSMIFASVWLP